MNFLWQQPTESGPIRQIRLIRIGFAVEASEVRHGIPDHATFAFIRGASSAYLDAIPPMKPNAPPTTIPIQKAGER